MQDTNLLEDQPIAWTPTPDVIERAQLTKFMRQVGVSTWDELYAYSINDVEKFTEEVIKFLDIKFDPPYEKLFDISDGIEFPNWFGRNADTPVRNEGEARTQAEVFANKKGWHERGFLPHFDGVATQFVTFRLGDSLPQNVLARLKQQLEHDKLSDNSDEYRDMVEDYLDKGVGACILRDKELAAIVADTIKHEDGQGCKLFAWVVMPNHVHLLLRPLDSHSLSDIIKRIKGVSSRRINQVRETSGQVWQPDYFDRFIRDEEHFLHTVNYIHANPVKAKLCPTPEAWEFSSASPKAAIADKSVRVPTAGLNITEMCLDRWQTDEMKDQPAVIWEGEEGEPKTLSYTDLLINVEVCSRLLSELGVAKGDAVGIHLPMILETVVSMLAINRLGAIAVPVFSGYGIEAITSRMEAVGAKVLLTCYGTTRRGKPVDMLAVASRAVASVASITGVIVVERCGEPLHTNFSDDTDDETRAKRINDFYNQLTYLNESIFAGRDARRWGVDYDYLEQFNEPLPPARTSAEDPLIILYTSGTTGKPKGIAHTHASFPIKAAQDMAFGTDVGKGTRISWYTDIGWMMGPWLIYGALINGATICIYDGAPDYPTPDRMWEFSAKHKVEILGISPTLVRSLAAAEERNADTPVRTEGRFGPNDSPATTQDGITMSVSPEEPAIADKSVRVPPFERHDLSSLRMFASTGEPWNPAPWWWLFKEVGNSKLPIINYSGGTEISGGILMGNPLLPQKPCSFPAPCPGMDVDIVDEIGEPVKPGEVGELVIKQPWIGMARGFWQEKERYLETYWRRFKDIWVHGDFAMRDKDGHWFILGRSDDTLKVAGKRVGPAEVESILVSHANVVEAAVIGVPDEAKGTAMVAFVVLGTQAPLPASSASADETVSTSPDSEAGWKPAFRQGLKALVARDMGKPLAPSAIHFVSALPKTRNAKVMRRVIRSAYLGEDPGDLSALENPHVVDEIRELGE